MRILEQFVRGKRPDQSTCEDIICTSPTYVAVIDGATSKTQTQYNNKTTGRIAAERICAAIETADATWDAATMMLHLNKTLSMWYQEMSMLNLALTHPHERATATVAIYSAHKREVWILGDCCVYINGTAHTDSKYIDTVTSTARALYIEEALASGTTVQSLLEDDTSATYIEPLLSRQQFFQNGDPTNPFYYAQLDGFFTDISKIRIIPIHSSTQEIALATDGYPRIKETLAASESYLQDTLADDPLMYKKHRSPKGKTDGLESFDDRAYVRIALND